MICPKCGSEFREGFTRCVAYDVELVQSPRLEPEVELVKVYETGNAALIPVFESLLNDAAIEFMTKGEGIQDMFGWGRFGTNLNYVIGPVEFYVRGDDADEARMIGDSLATDAVGLDQQEDDDSTNS
jgi:hypothetical protein